MAKRPSTPNDFQRAEWADVYVKIASDIEKANNESCCEIWEYLNGRGVLDDAAYIHPFYTAYAELFSPNGHVPKCAWFLPYDEMTPEEKQDWRVFALCLMAAMVEAGDA